MDDIIRCKGKRNQMAEIINIDKMARNVAETALDVFEYQGKTIREWMKIIAEQEPCDYAVNREAVREILAKYHLGESRMAEELNELPPVTQKSGEWIPVSEELPEEGQTVIASTEYGVYPEARYTKEYGWEWAYEAGADYWREVKGIEAWMPLPTRYEPQERKEKDGK